MHNALQFQLAISIQVMGSLRVHRDSLLCLLKDTDIDLSERWDAYKQACKQGIITSVAPYGDGFLDVFSGNFTPYDTFYIEKYETTDYLDLEERLLELNDDVSDAELNDWREKVLKFGESAFRYDW